MRQQSGVAIFVRVWLIRGDRIPSDKIPWCTESEETRFPVGHDSELPLVRGDTSPEVQSFRGDVPIEKSPRSLKFLPAPPAGTDYSTIVI